MVCSFSVMVSVGASLPGSRVIFVGVVYSPLCAPRRMLWVTVVFFPPMTIPTHQNPSVKLSRHMTSPPSSIPNPKRFVHVPGTGGRASTVLYRTTMFGPLLGTIDNPNESMNGESQLAK